MSNFRIRNSNVEAISESIRWLLHEPKLRGISETVDRAMDAKARAFLMTLAEQGFEVKPDGHGTRGRYSGGCRCVRCRTANAVYTKNWREQRSL